jgi:hypothetical protein
MGACHVGNGNWTLNPPPVAPPCAPSFHTVSLVMTPLALCRLVPPQARICGLDAGKSSIVNLSRKLSATLVSDDK